MGVVDAVMQKIIVMNAKGGCGKSTIATNIASYYASHGVATALFDHDPQGSSMQWLQRRPNRVLPIHGVAAYQHSRSTTRSWQLRVPPEVQKVVIDTPAGLKGFELTEHLKGVDAVVIPVLPSSIDINATGNFLRELLLVAKVNMRQTPIYIVPNRVKPRTRTFDALERFLAGLKMPVVQQLRDTVNYIRAAEQGLGVYELAQGNLEADRRAWDNLMRSLDPEMNHAQAVG